MALVAVAVTVLVGCLALAIDVGMLYNTRAELQRTADAAALAGAWELLDEGQLRGTPENSTEAQAARQVAATYAQRNPVLNTPPALILNAANTPDGDVVTGYLQDPGNSGEQISTGDPAGANAIRVRVRRDSLCNGPIPLYFANILGISSSDMRASATVVFKDGVIGYRATPGSGTGNAQLLPFALKVDSWDALLAGTVTVGDNYTCNPATGVVTPGSDGILELNLYPGAGATQLPPGNFGTVDIGNPNNSTADISRQIRSGVSAGDLAYFGGELKLGANGTLPLEGDTGLSAGFKDDLEAIKGQPRGIPLFSQVSGPGNNAVYTIVGFAGIRIVNVKLTGAMNKKEVVVQPAFVVDRTAVTGPGAGPSYFIHEPPLLVR